MRTRFRDRLDNFKIRGHETSGNFGPSFLDVAENRHVSHPFKYVANVIVPFFQQFHFYATNVHKRVQRKVRCVCVCTLRSARLQGSTVRGANYLVRARTLGHHCQSNFGIANPLSRNNVQSALDASIWSCASFAFNVGGA